MRISIIVAVAENGVIGRGGKLPWHLPADLQSFQTADDGPYRSSWAGERGNRSAVRCPAGG